MGLEYFPQMLSQLVYESLNKFASHAVQHKLIICLLIMKWLLLFVVALVITVVYVFTVFSNCKKKELQ